MLGAVCLNSVGIFLPNLLYHRFDKKLKWTTRKILLAVLVQLVAAHKINGNKLLSQKHRCDWANHETGIKMEDGFTLINLHQGLRTFEGDPFILASQAKQVFYSRDNDESNWYVLLKASPRGMHNMNLLEEEAYTSFTPLDVSTLEINITEKEPYARNECEGIDVTDL
ncbi:uncharacterized protein LOC142550291 [Primulina tabacum]|uniref:uncharacterized protein LOC142550291 n=1 Tax=Primulina tabacum TaxID=48773 RepID=UPI003F596535